MTYSVDTVLLQHGLKGFTLKIFFNVYLFLRERQSMSGGKAEREREREETQNLKQDPGSELSAQSQMWGSNSQTRS